MVNINTASNIAETETVEIGSGATTHPISVLGKAHQLLAAFGAGPSTMGLTELSRRSGVPKASAHRLAMELSSLGLLERTPDGYQLGWRMFELGQLVPGPASLRSMARPALMDLRSATKGVTHLAVPQGSECVYLERFAGRREMRLLASVEYRVPMHTTASGQLFLAYGDFTPSELDAATMPHLGITRRERDLRFASIRERRYSDENQRCVPGYKTIAVPVFGPATGGVVAAISISMAAERRDDQKVLHALWSASADISRGLGGPATRPRRSPERWAV
ncbi:IclR family transcriptional regulator [Gordonia desulfuricans]|uniref:IclR family transcriptional regulator n=1 Tax=Gordonia desulfuricans TaxID=89051 RepID=A0A7K3LS98_9ACTN|nr:MULTISPECIES: IclR family transcriptional regulator [Gordonia]NDK91153.1 IclR family transcriptional regulator [Gordonia desulfuricans]WLP88648.1 IclR family transcriptional regulator [Gordonia sp. NB41Y]